MHVNVNNFLGLLAIGGALVLAAPAERAQAVSLASPGIAAAVQDESGKLTTEVRSHRHHGWRRHHGWGRHYGWRRHHGWRHHYGWRRHHGWHRHYGWRRHHGRHYGWRW